VAFDPNQKFVRVNELRKDGFVEFEFAVGEPELFVEMILPAASFEEFCQVNAVTRLAPNDAESTQDDAWNWRLRDAREHRFR
jgi:phenol/toluene 2-monooxygenase (NADH) P0/A0